jgi:PTH1 family peptidyl-tRNA hydrolase
VKFLIFGLGNIGEQYHETRHNIGFMILDAMAQKYNVVFESARYAFKTLVKYRGKQLILLKPTTYMNLSGNAVRYWMKKENVSIERIMVIVDDVALPLGKLRLRKRGSDGGHNGLIDITEKLGTTEFPRLRVGIDDNFYPAGKVDYVLGKWTKEESDILKDKIETAIHVIEDFSVKGIERTMNTYN